MGEPRVRHVRHVRSLEVVADPLAAFRARTLFVVEDRTLQEQLAKRKLLKEKEQREIEKGQRTAVLTGAISIFLGVWLAIVFLLDSGNTLEPPRQRPSCDPLPFVCLSIGSIVVLLDSSSST